VCRGADTHLRAGSGTFTVTVAVSDVTSRLKTVTFPETTGGGAVYPQEGAQTATVSHAYTFTSGSTFSGSGAVTVSDRAGNVAGVSLTVTRDVVSPTAVLTVAKRSSRVTLTVAWGGEDGTGAGVAAYDVQVREDEGGWTDWLTGTGQTQGEYVGQYGHRYGFRVRATDRVSNTGDWVEGTSFLAWVTKYYAFNGQRVAMREGDVVYYLHGDHLGSTSVASSDSGALHSRQGYYPYGEVRYATGELPTEFGFTGQRNESTIGLYDYHARWYNPSLGRFISADTIVPEPASPSDFNRYAYVRNSPLKYIDPSGHGPPDWLERVQGAFMQFANDMLLGAPTLVFGDAWQYNPSEAFQEGRELGRVASKVTGIALTVDGAKNTAAGLTAMVPTAGVGTACTAGTGGACGVPTVAALTAEAGLVVGGVLEAGWGIAVVNYAKKHPVNGGEGDRRETSDWRPLAQTDLPSGYQPPRGGPRKVRVQHGKYRGRVGWLDKNGDIWVSTRPAEAHGGPHWDVQIGGGRGGHRNVYPDK